MRDLPGIWGGPPGVESDGRFLQIEGLCAHYASSSDRLSDFLRGRLFYI
jgi:hypothetical protein